MLYATLVAKLPVHLSIPHRLGCIQYQSGYELWLSDKSNTIDWVHYVAMWKSFHIRLLFYVYGTKIIFLHEITMPCRLRKWLHCVILRLSIYMYTWLQKILLSSSKHLINVSCFATIPHRLTILTSLHIRKLASNDP